MTTMMPIKCKCAICKSRNSYHVLSSTNSFGSPDLDLRPPEMMRSTMYLWVQECPKCGYVSSEVSDPSGVTKEWLQSKKFLTCDGISFASELAKRFYKYYLISLEDGKTEDAFYAVIHAAWACDDKGDTENAKHCRTVAIPLAAALIDKNPENKDNILLIQADLMRRACQFKELIDQYASVRFDEVLSNQILEFQIEKAKVEDAACYRVENVVKN